MLVEIDLNGARPIKAALPESVTVFLAPPSFDELARRLRGRGTESAAQFARRLETAREELAARDEFDVIAGQRRRAGRRGPVGNLVGRPCRTMPVAP